MSGQAGTTEQIAVFLGDLLAPLEKSLAPGSAEILFAKLGFVPPAGFLQAGPAASLSAAVSAVAGLIPAIANLKVAVAADDSGGISIQGIQSLSKIASLLEALPKVGSSMVTAAQADASFSPAQKLKVQAFASELPKRILGSLMIDQMAVKVPNFCAVLAIMGLIDIKLDPGVDGDPMFPPHINRAIRLDRFGPLMSKPLDYLKTTFGFGLPTFNGLELFERLQVILDNRYERTYITAEAGQPAVLETPTFRLAIDPSINPPALVFPLRFGLTEPVSTQVQLSDLWVLTIEMSGQYGADALVRLLTSGELALVPSSGSAKVNFSLSLTADRTGKPFTLLGLSSATRLTAEKIGVKVGFAAEWDATKSSASAQPSFGISFGNARAILDLGGGDSFVKKLIGAGAGDAQISISPNWSPTGGLRFSGSSGLEIALPVQAKLGPAELTKIYLRGGFDPAGALGFEFSAGLSGSLGPLTVVAERVGLLMQLRFPPDGGGNLGPLNASFAFKPPNGVGLSLDAGGFKGGGFLMFDSEKGEYAGALELDFQGMFSVKAIGIVNTKRPDGSPGFSLLIVIAAEFTPIQLSFGFTLNGVGGIFGLNRMIVVAALAEGIRTNAIKSILFPENVIANISRIISDIKQFFPPQDDHFVVGPMAKLGWGTPSLITVELGLLLDLPEPMFAIVGVLKAVLPEEHAPILRLQVNFIGVVDFARGYVFFRADLFDSRLLVFSITGSMAFLVSWGEEQTFALSVGGFHPSFHEIPTIPALPNGFQNMARIGISLLSDDNPRLKVESYFAVTSNTVQFGAKVELYAEAAGFNVYGFLGYDVLFQFDPFRFIARLYGGIALRDGSSVIAGINISVQLSGPTPWDAQGEASLEILFFEISVSFHVTWGDPPPAIPPATEDLLALLQRELDDTRNWRAELPPNNHFHVSLRQIDQPPGEMLVIHPAGVLTFSERSLPLEDYLIQKFGTKKPLNVNKFKLTNANSNGTIISADYQSVREQFAPNNFTELSDSEKLSRRSFERLPSGFKLTASLDLSVAGTPVTRDVIYELSYLRRKRLEFKGLVRMAVRAYDRLVNSSAVRRSPMAHQQNRTSLNAPAPVVLPPESFAVANAADLKSHEKTGSDPVLFATEAEAYQRQQELIARNPALAGQTQVVSHYELNLN